MRHISAESKCGAEMRLMKKLKGVVCLLLVMIMTCSIFVTAFAEGERPAEVEAVIEEVVDKVAQRAADAAAEQAAREAEAAKVNDIVDLDALNEYTAVSADSVLKESEEASGQNSARISGPILSMIVASVLIAFGLIVISFSNKKIKSGKKGKASK